MKVRNTNAGGNRKGNGGTRILRYVGGLNNRRPTHAAPELLPGQVRCPVCRNVTTALTSGHLRKHRDMFGHDCYNRAP